MEVESAQKPSSVNLKRNPLPDDWMHEIGAEFEKDYMRNLSKFLKERQASGAQIFPPGAEIFSAFQLTPFRQVKVVIVGQDPYHGRGQAHGLSFSVKKGIKAPPSLVNIFKELENDLGISPPLNFSGDLSSWAQQGVLMLNAVLTVEEKKAGAHRGKGWELFTDEVCNALAQKKEHLVFILWGNYAINKLKNIDLSEHKVIRSPHPSPFSAHNGFFGSKPFSQANQYLSSQGISPINWQLP